MDVFLSGWLHVITRNFALAAIRMEQRRRVREQEAAAMEERFAPEQEDAVLREKKLFPSVGRPGWIRTYLFADGHSEIHYSESGDFQDRERDRMVSTTGQ